MKARCINNVSVPASLTVGKVYEVEDGGLNSFTHQPMYKFLDDQNSRIYVYQHRFVLVDDAPATLPSAGVAQAVSQPSHSQQEKDLNEWRTWRDTGVKQGECVCGIPKTACSYHRG